MLDGTCPLKASLTYRKQLLCTWSVLIPLWIITNTSKSNCLWNTHHHHTEWPCAAHGKGIFCLSSIKHQHAGVSFTKTTTVVTQLCKPQNKDIPTPLSGIPPPSYNRIIKPSSTRYVQTQTSNRFLIYWSGWHELNKSENHSWEVSIY